MTCPQLNNYYVAETEALSLLLVIIEYNQVRTEGQVTRVRNKGNTRNVVSLQRMNVKGKGDGTAK